jgi:UDP-N-acetylmuramate--alanine ligase
VGHVNPVFIEDVKGLPDAIRGLAQADDVILIMGAGSISRVPVWLEANE